jgi:thiol-disulfide isomerase/thioredoxin
MLQRAVRFPMRSRRLPTLGSMGEDAMRRAGPQLLMVLSMFVLMLRPYPAGAELSGAALHKHLDSIGRWFRLADDPAHADSAWAGLTAMMPTLTDSLSRSAAWYVKECAAQSLGHVDSMRTAAESSWVYRPQDPGGLLQVAMYLSNKGMRLDEAETYARRTIDIHGDILARKRIYYDFFLLAKIQTQRGEDRAAIASLQHLVDSNDQLESATYLDLGDLCVRQGMTDSAAIALRMGLSTFPVDSTRSMRDAARLDSLTAARGGDVAAMRSRVAADLARSRNRFYLASWRDGRRAPEMAVRDYATGLLVAPGKAHGISVIYFWATWCGPCRYNLPHYEEFARRPRTVPVRFLTVNAEMYSRAESRANVKKFVTENKLRLPVLMADSVTFAKWKTTIPGVLVLKDGHVEYSGYSESFETGLELELGSLGSRLRK